MRTQSEDQDTDTDFPCVQNWDEEAPVTWMKPYSIYASAVTEKPHQQLQFNP
jgi:hypothetical protein